MTMITPSYLGDTIEYSSFEFKHNCSPGADHQCESVAGDKTPRARMCKGMK